MSDDEIQNTYLTGKAFQGDRSRAEIKKTLEQKIAGAQNKLNYLKANEKSVCSFERRSHLPSEERKRHNNECVEYFN